jgi:hypothetical protein
VIQNLGIDGSFFGKGMAFFPGHHYHHLMKQELCRWIRLGVWLFALIFALPVLDAAPSGALGGRKLLKIQVNSESRMAVVQVPPGFGEITLQRFEREGGWRRIATRTIDKPGLQRFNLRAHPADSRWRVIGRFQAAAPKRAKFPAAFFRGENRFGATRSLRNPWFLNNRAEGLPSLPGLSPDIDDDSEGGPAIPVEADIWKIDGSTVYFFNQLRGLQVLDLSNPADPRMTASLKMPAVGEDLYLLPGSGETRTVLLLTRDSSAASKPLTRIHQVEVRGESATVVHRVELRGELTDSRMMGSNLVVTTTEGSYWDSRGEVALSRIMEWRIAAGKAPQPATREIQFKGYNPLIAAGPDWLAVAVTPAGEWRFSEVTVFGYSREGGALRRLSPGPLRTAGVIADPFKLQWSNNVLTAISEKNSDRNGWRPVTVLENFRVWGPDVIRPAVVVPGEKLPIASLELAAGESLFATRFAGNKVYVVTFLQTDPLWVVDLSDPVKPVIAGHLEVPGWSTYLEPLGDLLLSIGWESDTVAASLFDVADPAAPTLIRRINLGEPGSHSEALWDEKALKVLPGAGLAMIPLTSYSPTTGVSQSSIQLLDIDLSGRELRQRGSISHAFDARRAAMIGDAVVSISRRVLVAADITDRDAPVIASEVSLAWPVDRVVEASGYLLQIEAGLNSYGGERATLRVSSAQSNAASERILAEYDLGDGQVRAVEVRDGRLVVLREIQSRQPYFYRSPVIGKVSPRLALDFWDLGALPALKLLGSCEHSIGENQQLAIPKLLWPQPDLAAVLMHAPQYWYGIGGWDMPVVRAAGSPGNLADAVAATPAAERKLSILPWPPPQAGSAPRLIVFNATDVSSPKIATVLRIGNPDTLINGTAEAADGLVVVGTTEQRREFDGRRLPSGKVMEALRVIEVPASGPLAARPAIDLPGSLFAVTEFDQRGFLAFTRSEPENGRSNLEVSACNGHDAFRIAGIEAEAYAATTADGRRLFVATSTGVDAHQLSANGEFSSLPGLETAWQPYGLFWLSGHLIVSDWSHLCIWNPSTGATRKPSLPGWGFNPEHLAAASTGGFWIPLGEYGVLDPVP